MKRKIIGILVCTLLLSTTIIPLSGETNTNESNSSGEVLDQKQEKDDDCLVIHDEWQEFKPTMNNLLRVELKAAQWHNSSTNCLMRIEKPLGNVLTQKELPFSAFQYGVCTWVSFDVPDISLTPGQSYYIRLIGTNGSDYGWSLGLGNPYSQGDSSKSGNDWCFRTYAEESGDMAPNVIINYPNDGDIVKDRIIILGEAHDANGDWTIDWVMVKIDAGSWVYANGTSNWSFDWNTKSVEDGLHTISVIASDGSSQSVVKTISVTVDNEEGPEGDADLIVTDVWYEEDIIYYQVKNIGNDSCPSGHYTGLMVDDDFQVSDLVDIDLGPGERFTSSFDYNWDCSSLNDSVLVVADYQDNVDESDETNNKREEFWKCDTTYPKITAGPYVQSISQNSATVFWMTDEESSSTVLFDNVAGEYGDIVEDAELVMEHRLILSNLEPITTYHFMVESTDAYDNSVCSRDFCFETSKRSDYEKPTLECYIPDRLSGVVNISVKAEDNYQVDRVIFTCDNNRIFTDFSDPYECKYQTSSLDDGEHNFGFKGVDDSGNINEINNINEVQNRYSIEESPIHINIIRPEKGENYYKGIPVPIVACIESDIGTCIEKIEVIIDSEDRIWSEEIECTIFNEIVFPPLYNDIIDQEKQRWIVYSWDNSDHELGPTTLEINAWDTPNNYFTSEVQFNLIELPPPPPPDPEFTVEREVVRWGNWYEVRLTIKNIGEVKVKDFKIFDTNVGFQCANYFETNPSVLLPHNSVKIVGGTDIYEKPGIFFPEGCYSQIQINIPHSTFVLEPGKQLKIRYAAVPIMYDYYKFIIIKDLYWWDSDVLLFDLDTNVIGYDLLIEYKDISNKQYSIQLNDLKKDYSHNVHYNCDSDVHYAFRYADYLIVTHPSALDANNPSNPDDVNKLLATMAELARLKNGVLGYTTLYCQEALYDYFEKNGHWWQKLRYPINNNVRGSFDYLLLVGEEEIIPSYRVGPFHIHWKGGGGPFNVDRSDKPYSHIEGDGKPDIAVGRIIGNTASDLIKPLQASIDIYNGVGSLKFDRSHALLVSGTGSGGKGFRKDVNKIEDILEPETIAKVLHWKYYSTAQDAFDAFRDSLVSDWGNSREIIVFRDHGNRNSWQPGLNSDVAKSLNFGSTKPFIFALACLTGDYGGGDGYSIAEALFDSGAAVYIGSTESSSGDENSDAGKRFFKKSWDPGKSIGTAFKDLKRHYYNDDLKGGYKWWKFWCYEYNLYGDPKYGASTSAVLKDESFDVSSSLNINFEDPPPYLEIVISDYEVDTFEDIDYVEIPDGEIYSVEEGRPEVPYYVSYVEYPKGYRVQNVILSERSGLRTDTGLELPITQMDPYNESEMIGDWYPLDDYSWRVEENSDGSTTLVISMYPFYYNPDTTEVKFYKYYDFDIEYVYSDITITELYTDKYIYKPGDMVNIDMWFENTGESQDFIVKMLIKNDLNENITDGLLLKSLKDFKGIGSYSPIWETEIEIITDSFFIEATIMDTNGNILDIETDMFCLDTPTVEIESLSGGFGLSATVKNTDMENITDLHWSITVDGNMVFLGEYKEGNIPIIEPGETYTIKSGLVLGFGPAEINLNVAGVTKKVSCFLLGPLVLSISD